MTTLRRLGLATLLLLLAAPASFADGILLSWSPRDVEGVTQETHDAAKALSASAVIEGNLKVTSWADAFLLMVAAQHLKGDAAFKSALVAQVTNNKQAPLRGTKRLIIWERITSGEILFEGKGYHTHDDLFTVGGRANWILRNLTSKTFGYVRPNSSESDLQALQGKWVSFLSGKDAEEYKPAIVAKEGLDEIKSLEALEGLIASLKPTATKEQTTRDCLRKLYGRDKLPKDPDDPANLCSPDAYTHRYLSVLTGEKATHDAAWWARWWTENRERLTWDADKQVFVARRP